MYSPIFKTIDFINFFILNKIFAINSINQIFNIFLILSKKKFIGIDSSSKTFQSYLKDEYNDSEIHNNNKLYRGLLYNGIHHDF